MYSIPFSFDDLLNLVKSLSIEDKVRIEKEIEKETLIFRSKKLSLRIKENDIKIGDIVNEVAEYRSGKK